MKRVLLSNLATLVFMMEVFVSSVLLCLVNGCRGVAFQGSEELYAVILESTAKK